MSAPDHERSELCGCFYCLAMFPPSQVSEWIDEVDDIGTTAMCPKRGIDSVIGAASGISHQRGIPSDDASMLVRGVALTLREAFLDSTHPSETHPTMHFVT